MRLHHSLLPGIALLGTAAGKHAESLSEVGRATARIYLTLVITSVLLQKLSGAGSDAKLEELVRKFGKDAESVAVDELRTAMAAPDASDDEVLRVAAGILRQRVARARPTPSPDSCERTAASSAGAILHLVGPAAASD